MQFNVFLDTPSLSYITYTLCEKYMDLYGFILCAYTIVSVIVCVCAFVVLYTVVNSCVILRYERVGNLALMT